MSQNQTSRSKRLRLTLPPGWWDRLLSCAALAGVPPVQEASMLLCAGISLAEKRWRQLGLFPDDQCQRCGQRKPDVAAYREPFTDQTDPLKWLRLCDDCAIQVAEQKVKTHTTPPPEPTPLRTPEGQ